MSGIFTIKIAEHCSCGAKFAVEGMDFLARREIEKWRALHKNCIPHFNNNSDKDFLPSDSNSDNKIE